LLAVLVSWTTMLRISPTPVARLSLTIGAELPSCQRESARAVAQKAIRAQRATTTPRSFQRLSFCQMETDGSAGGTGLQGDKDCLFILNLSFEFTARLWIANADELTRSAILKHLDFDRNAHDAILKLRIDELTATDDRLEADRTSVNRRAGGNVLGDFKPGV